MGEGSRLCRDCRRRAVQIGVAAVAARATLEPQQATGDAGVSPAQNSGIHAKAADLAATRIGTRRGPEAAAAKLAILEQTKREASSHFGRPIGSLKQLSRFEASWALDRLDEQLAALALALAGEPED
jgi:hypothetical protein